MALDFFLADTLVRWGFYDFILPFVLIFTIIFAVLQKVKIFGDEGKRYNVIIALVIGLSAVIPHTLGLYPPGQDIIAIMLTAIPNVTIVIVAILMALLIIGMLGKRFEIGGNSLSGWIAFAAFIVVVYIFGAAAGWWPRFVFERLIYNQDLLALVVTILVFAIIIWFVTSEEKDKKQDENSFANQLSGMLQGKK